MKLLEREPVFLRIQWHVPGGDQDNNDPLEATLCRAHREEIFLSYPSARGYGRFGSSCDLCEGRRPGQA
jgi:ADP-ribose pyrophosphatase YjhB (NUDIX family)